VGAWPNKPGDEKAAMKDDNDSGGLSATGPLLRFLLALVPVMLSHSADGTHEKAASGFRVRLFLWPRGRGSRDRVWSFCPNDTYPARESGIFGLLADVGYNSRPAADEQT